jgi:hypothetical protein
VLAHEPGTSAPARHEAHALTFIFSLVGLAILGWLVAQPWFYTGLGMSQPSTHAALMLFMLIGPVFTFFLQPLLAQARAATNTRPTASPPNRPMPANWSALVKLYRENASTHRPDPLHSRLSTISYRPPRCASRIWRAKPDAARKEEPCSSHSFYFRLSCSFRFRPGRDFAWRCHQRQKLYDARCTTCHNDSVYKRKDHKIKSLEGLTEQIHNCEHMADITLKEPRERSGEIPERNLLQVQ